MRELLKKEMKRQDERKYNQTHLSAGIARSRHKKRSLRVNTFPLNFGHKPGRGNERGVTEPNKPLLRSFSKDFPSDRLPGFPSVVGY